MKSPIDLAEAYLDCVVGTWSRLGIVVAALVIGHPLGLLAAAMQIDGTGFALRKIIFGDDQTWPFTLVSDWLSGCTSFIGAIYVLVLPAIWFFSVWREWSMAKVAVALVVAQAWQSFLVNTTGWILIFTDPVSQTFRAVPGLYALCLLTVAIMGLAAWRQWKSGG